MNLKLNLHLPALPEKKSLPLNIAAPLIFAGIFITLLLYSRIEPHIEEVDTQYVITHRDNPKFVLLDVRSEVIFNGRAPFAGMKAPPFEGLPGGHIPGSINFPMKDLNAEAAFQNLEKKGITRDAIIILYDNTGITSSRFADTLVRRFNYSPGRLKHYRGGVADWIRDEKNIMLPEDHDPPYYSNDYWMSYAENYAGSSGGK